MTYQDNDPFAGGTKTPAVSFKDAPMGATVVLVVTEPAALVQSRDYDTGKPAFWEDGGPKMSAVVKGTVNGEERAIWAAKPSSMFAAIAEAQQVAGARIAPGGTLTVQLIGEKPSDNPRKAAQKLYRAHYAPGDAFSAAAATTPAAVPVNTQWPPAGAAAGQPAAAPAAQAAPAPAAMTTDPAALAAQLGGMATAQSGAWNPTASDEPPF